MAVITKSSFPLSIGPARILARSYTFSKPFSVVGNPLRSTLRIRILSVTDIFVIPQLDLWVSLARSECKTMRKKFTSLRIDIKCGLNKRRHSMVEGIVILGDPGEVSKGGT